MAFRNARLPYLKFTDMFQRPDLGYELYGEESRDPGKRYCRQLHLSQKAPNRRQDVNLSSSNHQGWDHHGNLPKWKIKNTM